MLLDMEDRPRRKRESLKVAGLLNPHPERVDDPLFHQHPTFFDAHDQLQIRYEMLRSQHFGQQSVVVICRRFGVSRQTFYHLQERFVREGTAGLLWKKPGPKGPVKLTAEVLRFVEQQLQHHPDIGTRSLISLLAEHVGVTLHKRTVEKLLKELRSKKNS